MILAVGVAGLGLDKRITVHDVTDGLAEGPADWHCLLSTIGSF